MLSTTNTEQLFGLACSGNIKALEDYWNGEGNLNVTYQRLWVLLEINNMIW